MNQSSPGSQYSRVQPFLSPVNQSSAGSQHTRIQQSDSPVNQSLADSRVKSLVSPVNQSVAGSKVQPLSPSKDSNREPPVFVRELHDIDITEGDPVELLVEVKGKNFITF